MEGFVAGSEAFTRKKGRNLLIFFLVISVVAMANYYLSKSSPLLSEFFLEQQEFSNFLILHNKKYSSDSEFQYRFQVYHENTALIRAHNSLDSDVLLAANKFADLTQAEFKALYTQEIAIKYKNLEENLFDYDLPPSIWDWRTKGAVTDVKDQTAQCHSSWAFASVAAIESAWKISGHELIDLSVQEILDCQTTTGAHGCKGGIDDDAFQFVLENNITSQVNYPYVAVNNTCNHAAVQEYVASISNYSDVKPGQTASLIYGLFRQPVVSAVQADQYVWQFYQQGVMKQFCGDNVNHYILIVGYNMNQYFYSCKNSWGQDWGESGYVRIGFGAGNGVCGIQTLISYPNSTFV